MIVDDEHVIIGSANVNDRSQLGTRDSEVCLHFHCHQFAKDLREQIWSNFLGENLKGKNGNQKPESEEFFTFWKNRSSDNTYYFDDVFRLAPHDDIKTWKNLVNYRKELIPLIDHDVYQAREVLDKIKGVLVNYPTQFLEDENFSQKNLPITTKEYLAPWNMFI